METFCQVNFRLMNGKETRRAEAILREYLLRTADSVEMAVVGASYLSIFNIFPHRFQSRRFARMLNPDDVAEKGKHSWSFKLTDNVKNLLNHSTIFVDGSGRFFYGFTDPLFYKNGKEIASMITNEQLLNLYISDTDKAELASKGVYLDSPEF